jgi:cell division protein FtsI (penicillin-binding protein 3)
MNDEAETLFATADPPSSAESARGGFARPRSRFRFRPQLFPNVDGVAETGRSRLFITCAVFVVAFAVVSAKLIDASLYDPTRTVRLDPGRAASGLPEPEQLRADVVDRNGELIATSLPIMSLCARSALVRDPAATAFLVAGVLPDANAAVIQAQLERGRDFVWLKRHISPAQHKNLLALGQPSLCFEREQRRVYPQDGLVAHIVGFTDLDGNGLAGIERTFDDVLKDRREPLKLSVDLRIQRIVRSEVQRAMDRFRAIGGVGMMMDVQTAEVIAMVSLPDFDPNDPGTASANARFNRATLGVYEMGSTFKLFTAAQAMQAGVANLGTMFDATQPIKIGRFKIRDFHAKNRWMSLEEVLIHSSNVGAAKMAELSGPAAQRDFLGKLGLLTPSRLEVAERGSPLTPRRWAEVNMFTISFGHGLAVTPTHMTTAIASLVNGGAFRQGTILKRLDGDYPKGKQVVSKKVSDRVRWLMRQVVVNGTGRNADTNPYPVGGKTGTAEKARGRRGYDKHAKLASFISAFPIHDPKYVLLVMVDEPKPRKDTFGYATGGWVAAPAVKAIVERSGPVLGMKPLGEEAPARQQRILQIKKRPRTRT